MKRNIKKYLNKLTTTSVFFGRYFKTSFFNRRNTKGFITLFA